MDGSHLFRYQNRPMRAQAQVRPMRMRPNPYGGGMFGMFGRSRPPPFFGGGQFGGRRPFPGMYRGMPTFMNRMGGGGRFGGMQRPPIRFRPRPPFGGGFRPPFGGNEGGFGGTDYSSQISELEKKIKELQSQLSGQPAASPAMPEPLPAMPKPPTASYNPVPQVDVDAYQQFKAGMSAPDFNPGTQLYNIRGPIGGSPSPGNPTGELVPDPAQIDQGPTKYVTKAEAEMRRRQRAAGIAGISVPDFNMPPGTPMAIPPSVGGQYEEPAREFLKGTPAPLDPNYALQPGDPGYAKSGGPARPDFILPSNIQFNQKGGIGGLSLHSMGATGGHAAPTTPRPNNMRIAPKARMMMNRR